MTVAAVVLLAATAVVAAVLWYLVDRRRDRVSTTTAVLAAAVPTVLLGAAALLAVAGSAADDGTLRIAHVVAVAAAIPGGGLVARAVLRLADRRPGGGLAGDEKPSRGDRLATTDSSPAVPLPPPPPPPPPAASSSPPAWTPHVPWEAPRDASASPSVTTGSRTSQAVSDPETLRGGATIGSLERVAIVVSLLAGWPEGLALTLAIKGFGRYPELRKPSAPERFIIGTFASILWAAAVAGIVVALRP